MNALIILSITLAWVVWVLVYQTRKKNYYDEYFNDYFDNYL